MNTTTTTQESTMIATTASALVAGQTLHRVQPRPRSRVFEAAIDAPILSVQNHPDFPGIVRVVLEPKAPARHHVLNLDPARVVYVA